MRHGTSGKTGKTFGGAVEEDDIGWSNLQSTHVNPYPLLFYNLAS